MLFTGGIAVANAKTMENKTEPNLLPEISDQLKNKLKRGAYFVLGIEEKLQDSSEELKLLQKNMRELENRVADSKVQIKDLESQMGNLDRLITKNKEKVFVTELQIAQYENAICGLEEDIEAREIELNKNVKSLDKLLLNYYLQTNAFFGAGSDAPSLLAMLSAEESIGEILKENEYLFFLQDASQTLVQRILADELALDDKQSELENKKERLSDLREIFMREKNNLLVSQNSRKRLLAETQGRQIIYETLLELSKKELAQVSEQIERLRENYAFFQQKLDELAANPEAAGLNLKAFEIDENQLLKNASHPLAWPVSPALGISAFYHDAAYQKALGIQHNAIDIRIEQGSKVKAAADGVVSKVADNGFTYSYIIIAHPDKMLTLYGHMSEMLVEEGEIVKQGQVIGLSGGIPGTRGAGWLTTGAHLHFEIFKNWKQTDPLEYLPLEFVPIASLPEKYVKMLTGEEREKVRRAPLSL